MLASKDTPTPTYKSSFPPTYEGFLLFKTCFNNIFEYPNAQSDQYESLVYAYTTKLVLYSTLCKIIRQTNNIIYLSLFKLVYIARYWML